MQYLQLNTLLHILICIFCYLLMNILAIFSSPMSTRVHHIHPIILTIGIQMQTQRLITFPSIGISCDKPSYTWLIVSCPQIDFLRLFIVVFPTITVRVLILFLRFYFVSKGIILICLCDISGFIQKLHHIAVHICDIIRSLRILSFIGIH